MEFIKDYWFVMISIIYILFTILKYTQMSYEEVESHFKKNALVLFLYAEKQGWDNEEKMNWCVDTFYNKLPASIQKIFLKELIKEELTKVYDDFKDFIKLKLSENS